MDKPLVLRYAIREILGLVIMGTALFWSAGQIGWWPAWATLAATAAWVAATAIIIIRFNPALLAERLGPRKGAKPWDILIMSMLGLAQLVKYITAGLDHRFGWTEDFPLWIQTSALLVCVLGYFLIIWATAANSFFSQIVRIQSERGHTLVTEGPYRFLRHPAYLGASLYELAVPVLLASWWALIVGGLTAILLILRTYLEDRTLQNELKGYSEYSRQVHFRLIPGIW